MRVNRRVRLTAADGALPLVEGEEREFIGRHGDIQRARQGSFGRG
jgi:hypothetical protein